MFTICYWPRCEFFQLLRNSYCYSVAENVSLFSFSPFCARKRKAGKVKTLLPLSGPYVTKRRRQRAVIIRRQASVSTRRRGRDISRRISGSLGMHSVIPFVTARDCGRSSRSDKRMSTCFECGAHLAECRQPHYHTAVLLRTLCYT